MKQVPLIKQHNEKDCGAASVCMILSYYGKHIPLSSAREAVQVDQHGASIYGLQTGSKKFGLNSCAYEGSPEDVWEALKDNACIPAIIRIVNRYGFEHYIVAEKFKGNTLYVCDPGEGRKKYSYQQFEEAFLGQIVCFEKAADFKKENCKKGSLSRFTKLLFTQKKLLFTTSLLSLFVTAIGLAGAFLFQFLIDNVLYDFSEDALDSFAVIITGLAILYIARFISEIIRGKLLCRMSKNLDIPLMLGYSDHMTELPMRFFDTHKTGEILSRFDDASKVRNALSSVTLTLLIDTVLTLGCGFILYKESRTLFLVALCIFIAYLLTSWFYMKPLEKFNHELMENNSQLTSYLKESIDAAETVKVCQAESSVNQRTHGLFLKLLERNLHGSMMQLSKESIVELLTSIGTVVLLWIGTIQVINGNISVGELITFYTLLTYFLSPIESIINLQTEIQSGLVAADRLNDVLDVQKESGGTEELNDDIKTIEFDHVNFRYGNRQLVLNNMSFNVQTGEQIALVGESGSGKSTISKLILGLYSVENGNGEIRINGYPISEYSLDSIRRQMAFVPQKIDMFSDTILNNLLIGLTEDKIPTEEKINHVLEICQCGFIKEMPFGIHSMLEEHGANLSGGQRQRLAIARALLRHPKVLILDEATSGLDSITEFTILKNLKKLFPEMIVITIAHRLSTVKHANHIYVIKNGTVVEHGTHEELLKKSTTQYAEMWNKQNACAA